MVEIVLNVMSIIFLKNYLVKKSKVLDAKNKIPTISNPGLNVP